MIGESVAHFRVLEKIGEGGMGAVYKARDTHLDRLVALKVLPAARLADPERKRRFVQEAKAASALSHPNIITIHDISSDRGIDYIAMEYVQGRTLGEAIGRKGMKLGAALRYAVQIADALARAHAVGIVHRDLKPSNIMVTDEGAVKVLDFGLAKLTDSAGTDDQAPTETAPRDEEPQTEKGTILGTVAYMSPEQAQGMPVDGRSDIFSFGSVFYEMLTGRRPFQGETKLATLSAILEKDPTPPGEITGELPAEVERMLERCLRKDPKRRWQSMSDLKVVLQDLKEESESGKLYAVGAARSARPAKRRWLLPAAAVLLLALVAVWLWRVRPVSAPAELEIARFTFDTGSTLYPAITRDGKLVAYASDRGGDGNFDIWVQQVAGGRPVQRTHNQADDVQPSFSPDGARIAFRSERDGGGIYIIDTLGGEERQIAAGNDYWPQFSPDGSRILYTEWHTGNEALNRMYLISPDGGTPEPLQPGFYVQAGAGVGPRAVWSPDGHYVLFAGTQDDPDGVFDWWVAPMDGGPAAATGAASSLRTAATVSYPCVWLGNSLIFSRGTTVEGINLFRVKMHPGDWKIAEEPERLTSGPGAQMLAVTSSDNRLMFANISALTAIWLLDLDPESGEATGSPRRITGDASPKFSPSLSRDGSKVAYISFAGRRGVEMRIADIASGGEKVLAYRPPSMAGLAMNPVLNVDGTLLAYREIVDGKMFSFFIGTNSAQPGKLCENCRVMGFTRDSRQALVRYGARELALQDLASGARTVALQPESGSIGTGELSPDDRWIAFPMFHDLSSRLFIAPLGTAPAAESQWLAVANDSRYIGSPSWSPDGRILYYLSEHDGRACIWGQRLDPTTKKPVGEPFGVYHAHQGSQWLNMPRGNGTISVGQHRMAFLSGEISGNLWTATLPDR